MDLLACDTQFPFGYDDCFSLLDGFKRDFDVGAGDSGVSSSVSHSIVLDNEKGELVKAQKSSRAAKKSEASEEKALAALRNHSEAERRRRERINSHLATLRGLVPCADKMDKATLLAEVINQVKELKKKATDASRGLLIPMDSDEVTVEQIGDAFGNGSIYFKATICCEHHPELFSDLRQAVDSLHLKITKAEVSTLENRLKNVFVISTRREEITYDANACRALAGAIRRELSSIVSKASASSDYSPTTILSSKKRRISSFDSLTSSSLVDVSLA